MKTNYIFGASLPRAGTKLSTFALCANPKLLVAPNPNVELFRFLKKDYSKIFKSKRKLNNFKANFVIEDYYNNETKVQLLHYILNSNLNIKFRENLKEFQSKSFKRSQLEALDLSEQIKNISGTTYKEIIENQIKIITKRSKNICTWVGFSESWAIEFFPAIARSFPNSKFIVNIRDPRATIYANQNITKKKRRAQILSYSRHFRKQIALISYYLKSNLLKNRIHIFFYESLVFDPKNTIKDICNFLNVNFNKKSLDFKKFINPKTNKRFTGHSVSKKILSKFDSNRTHFWKKKIDINTLKYIEFLCHHELKFCGYKPFFEINDLLLKNRKKINLLFQKDLKRKVSWRSDSGNIKKEINFEFKRHNFYKAKNNKNIKKFFLTEEFYKNKLKNNKININLELKKYNKALQQYIIS